jgi:hypothetical protein
MKNSICFLLLIFLSLTVKAQPYSSLNQDQLNFALKKANDKISTGVTLTLLGVVTGIIGVVTYSKGVKDLGLENDYDEFGNNAGKAITGLFVTLGGLGLMGAGIPIWATGAHKKNKIELELVRFKSQGSASINGIGLKIRF